MINFFWNQGSYRELLRLTQQDCWYVIHDHNPFFPISNQIQNDIIVKHKLAISSNNICSTPYTMLIYMLLKLSETSSIQYSSVWMYVCFRKLWYIFVVYSSNSEPLLFYSAITLKHAATEQHTPHGPIIRANKSFMLSRRKNYQFYRLWYVMARAFHANECTVKRCQREC